jgi:hypothetical protein
LLPATCYRLETIDTHVFSSDNRVFLPVVFNLDEIAKLKNKSKYALSLKIVADGLEVNKQKEAVLIIPIFDNEP